MSQDAIRPTAHVLVVDDDPNVLALLSDALTSFGYGMSPTTTGEQALDLAREKRFDVVLCNLRLQGMNGIVLTRAFCRMHPQVPVVLLTAFGDVEAGKQAVEAGASDFVTKPIEVTTLPFILENNIQRKKMESRRLSEDRAEVLFKAIKALAAAVDAKSEFTDSHSARTAELCLEIGIELGLSQDDLNTLEFAAHIHDVGKIGTPESVLTKPGKLSDDEWVDILKHPANGADFLAGIEELSEVAAVVRHHHERLDGSGYPDGLKGEAIPFLARILAAADAFEAMTSDRPYRDAVGVPDALGELRAHAGVQFDTDVVEATITAIERHYGSKHGKKAA